MNNRAFIVAEKNFPERLCLFYIDDEHATDEDVIKLVIGNIYQMIDKSQLAKHTNIIRIQHIETSQTTHTILTNVRDDDGTIKKGKETTTTKRRITFGLGHTSKNEQTKELISCELNKDLLYHAYDNPESLGDSTPPKTEPPREPVVLNSGNVISSVNTNELLRRLSLNENWGSYVLNHPITHPEQTNETVKAYCLANDPYLKRLTALKEKKESAYPENHRDELTRKITKLEQTINESANAFITPDKTTTEIESLNEAVNQAVLALNDGIRDANFGNGIAKLVHAKQTLICLLQNAASAYATYVADNTVDQELPVLEQFMATAKLLNDNFNGIAYLDCEMNYQAFDLNHLTLDQLVLLVNITLKPARKKTNTITEPTIKQDSKAYDELVTALKEVKAPFALKMPGLLFRLTKFAKLKLDENHTHLESLGSRQEQCVAEKRDALHEALNARDNYPKRVYEAYLVARPLEETEALEKNIAQLERHAKKTYCDYLVAAEALKATTKELREKINSHSERAFTPMPLILMRAMAEDAECQEISTEYTDRSKTLVEIAKTALTELAKQIPAGFNKKNISDIRNTVDALLSQTDKLIHKEASELESLHTSYQDKINERQEALQAAAEAARREEEAAAAAAEAARRQEEAAAAAAAIELARRQEEAAELARRQEEKAAAAEETPITVKNETSSNTTPSRSKKQIAILAGAAAASVLAGVGITFLCALTLPASLPIIVAIAIGAATSLLIGAPSITTIYCCLFKQNTNPGGDAHALHQSLSR